MVAADGRARCGGGESAGFPVLESMPLSLRPAADLARASSFAFAIALAAPQTAFTREEVTYPGRRVAILIDSSNSMILSFTADKLKAQGKAAFFTAVAAAETFMKVRMNGPYHDLMALIQFGNYAYVVTPFTNDYQNILLSIGLVGSPKEWGRFDDAGTTIIQGMEEGLALFKTFFSVLLLVVGIMTLFVGLLFHFLLRARWNIGIGVFPGGADRRN